MIIVGEKAYLKSYDKKMSNELNLDNKANEVKKMQDAQLKNLKVSRKASKSSNNDIYKNIKNKASILKNDKRDIQEKVTLIQVQEQKINNMEASISEVKTYYLKEIKNEKEEENKAKVKIRKIKTQVDELNKEYKYEIIELSDSQQILEILNVALKRIDDIKNKLSQYKSRLLNLENMVEKNKNKLEHEENKVKEHDGYKLYLDEEIIIDISNSIYIQGDMNIGILIDIFI